MKDRTYEVQNYLTKTMGHKVRKRIICKDGFSVSVQATEYAYCQPRVNISTYGWDKVELGYPSEAVPEWMEYIDGADSEPTDTVYGYVPIEIVERVIQSHGGIDWDATKPPNDNKQCQICNREIEQDREFTLTVPGGLKYYFCCPRCEREFRFL